MSAGLEIWRMNAFTDQPFSGNPAGVVLDGGALDEQQMQRIAPQLNSISETVFVCPATAPSADLRLRYFTSRMEVDLCGHATVAALFALVASGRLSGAQGSRTLRAETRSGVLELGLEFSAGRLQRASMVQPVARHGEPGHPERAARVLGLPASAVRGDLPVACTYTGIWSCYVPLRDLDALAAVQVDSERIESLWPDNPDFAGVYPFVLLDEDDRSRELGVRSRFFSPPRFGIVEDPVTGTASGALAAYLQRAAVLPAGATVRVQQGVEMGCPGSVLARQLANGEVEIRGQAVPIFRGELLL
jgi:PhzF family phenazine biosynthesis protein